jgi:hypothetical protein
MRNLGIQAPPSAAHAFLPQLVPSQTNPKPSGDDRNLRAVFLQHPRGFPFASRRLDRWWRLPSQDRSGTELCFIAEQVHPIGSRIELSVPLRSGEAALRGSVIRIRQTGPHWETSVALAPEAGLRAALLARICELERRLHGTQASARLVEARRRADDWQRLRTRLARLPALYAQILTLAGRARATGWPPPAATVRRDPTRPYGVPPQ